MAATGQFGWSGRQSAETRPLDSQGRLGRLLRPLERLLRIEALGGVVLLAAAVLALVCANSPWSAWYERTWATRVAIGIGPRETLRFWINEGLMTLFFLIVGLDLRHEFHQGILSDLRRAFLPIAAATGGMLVPALIYLGLNTGPINSRGWGVPIATDIAFSLGVLVLLGKRVPPSLRLLLLALATVDDIGSVLVVALFYPQAVSIAGLLIAAGGILGILLLLRFGVGRLLAYTLPAAIVWMGAFRAGLHPGIAGIPIGLLVPMKKGETLHRVVAYAITPLFALANAGVSIQGFALNVNSSMAVVWGVLLGRVLGKPAGILLASFATITAGISTLPPGVTWRGILTIGCLAGIGLTVPIYVAGVAFADQQLLAAAKLGLILASVASAAIGLFTGRLLLARASI